jgi:hypothetical protein
MATPENILSATKWVSRDLSNIRAVVDGYRAELKKAQNPSFMARLGYKLMVVYKVMVRSSFLNMMSI